MRRLLPLDRRGAVAAKDLRYFARHPRLRVLWLTSGLLAIILPGLLLLSHDGPRELAALGALASLYTINLGALNQFGPDGAAYWVSVAAGGGSRADLVGKNLALALPGFALVSVVSVALSAVGGGWVYLPVTLCLAAGILGIILGVAPTTCRSASRSRSRTCPPTYGRAREAARAARPVWCSSSPWPSRAR